MAEYIGRENAGHPGGLDCERWEALLADRMDGMEKVALGGSLTSEEEASFLEHSRGCVGCGELLEQARQGREWLKLLSESAPPAPMDLLSRILAQTQGAGRETDFPLGSAALAGMGTALPPQAGSRWAIPFLPQRRAIDPRMLMTAAMAFFSVALTLSLAGVKITSVHAAELRPQAVQANMTRSFYGTKKQVVSFYENLRLVYEVESKMQDLRRNVQQTPQTPAAEPANPAPAGNQPKAHGAASVKGSHEPASNETVVRGWAEFVSLRGAGGFARKHGPRAAWEGNAGVRQALAARYLKAATSKGRNRI